MPAILYIFLACCTGLYITRKIVPYLERLDKTRCLTGEKVNLGSWMILLPGAFLTGTLVMVWITYLAAYMFRNTKDPMLYGNLVAIWASAAFVLLSAVRKTERYKKLIDRVRTPGFVTGFVRANFVEIILIIVSLVVWSFFMVRSLSVSGNTLRIGFSVYSDFGPHLSVIRSFSMGKNFPTEYPHFAGDGIRYHFMFQFLAGNLEYLGLPIDWAFNLPSVLSIVSFHMLLYSLAVLIFNSRLTGILASVFFFFRSSFAFFTFISCFDSLATGLKRILANSESHIGRTTHEDWGLWAQKVYVNQRHFPFALGILILIIIAILPLLRKMIWKIHELTATATCGDSDDEALAICEANSFMDRMKYGVHNPVCTIKSLAKRFLFRIGGWAEEFVLRRDAWLPQNLERAVFAGVVFGLLSFWNGAVVIAGLSVLFVLAVFSKHRLEFLIIAVITTVLAFLESEFFIGRGVSAVSPGLFIGFLSGTKEFTGIIKYYVELLGVLPFVIISALFILPKGGRILTLAFIAPIVLATTLKLTPDITVNHKYVIMGVIFLGIISANFVSCLVRSRKVWTIPVAVILIFLLTVTGFADIITLYNMDKRRVELKLDDPVLEWVANNTAPDEIFLTDAYCIDPVLLAGRRLFYGWPYYAWSAGYNTYERADVVRKIYGGSNIGEIRKLIEKYGISYIVVEDGNRNSTEYSLNEKLIKENFKPVYINQNYTIYRTY